jgi:hypothetical protein
MTQTGPIVRDAETCWAHSSCFYPSLARWLANMRRLRCPTVRSVGILLSILRPFRPVNVMIACRRAMPRCNKTELIERTCSSTISRANQLLPSWYFWTRCHYQRPPRLRFDCNLGTPIFSLAHIIFNRELHARLLFLRGSTRFLGSHDCARLPTRSCILMDRRYA